MDKCRCNDDGISCFCDLETLKATVQGRPSQYRYVRVMSHYKRVIAFNEFNKPPKAQPKEGELKLTYAEIPIVQDMELLAYMLRKGQGLTQEVREWLAQMLTGVDEHGYHLQILRPNKEGGKKRKDYKNWVAVEEYESLAKSDGDNKARDTVRRVYGLDVRQMSESIKQRDIQHHKRVGTKPPKKKPGRPKKHA